MIWRSYIIAVFLVYSNTYMQQYYDQLRNYKWLTERLNNTSDAVSMSTHRDADSKSINEINKSHPQNHQTELKWEKIVNQQVVPRVAIGHPYNAYRTHLKMW